MGKKEGGAKSLVDKVVEVIKVQNSPGGSSRQALVKGMKEQFPEVEAAQLKAALKKGVAAKVLEQNGQRLLGIFFPFWKFRIFFSGFGSLDLHPHLPHLRRLLTLLMWR